MEIARKIKIYEISTACILFFIPLILKVVDGEWRKSISNYAYSDKSEWYCTLVTIGAMMFILNYVINKKHSYNLIVGLSLLGVCLTPHIEYAVLHYTFAAIFFGTSLLAIPLSSSQKNKEYKYMIVAITLTILALHFTTKTYSLLVAEWVALLPIVTHFIIKSINFDGII
jgi:hypothetical protein